MKWFQRLSIIDNILLQIYWHIWLKPYTAGAARKAQKEIDEMESE